MKKSILIICIALITLAMGSTSILIRNAKASKINPAVVEKKENETGPTPTAKVVLSTDKTSPEVDVAKLYGPCATVKVLMYHHIEEYDVAKKSGYQGLSVSPEFFREQMKYLKDHNYNVVYVDEIAAFFDKGVQIPAKTVAITLDDAYEDNYTHAYPVLKEFGLKATIFTPTGLVNNPGYLTWDEIREMNSSGNVRFANHTWSHHSSSGSVEEQDKEIQLADSQLQEKGLDSGKIFAYPYGNPSSNAEKILGKYGYTVAFTTRHGQQMCKGQRYELPRIRAGNNKLSAYGF